MTLEGAGTEAETLILEDLEVLCRLEQRILRGMVFARSRSLPFLPTQFLQNSALDGSSNENWGHSRYKGFRPIHKRLRPTRPKKISVCSTLRFLLFPTGQNCHAPLLIFRSSETLIALKVFEVWFGLGWVGLDFVMFISGVLRYLAQGYGVW